MEYNGRNGDSTELNGNLTKSSIMEGVRNTLSLSNWWNYPVELIGKNKVLVEVEGQKFIISAKEVKEEKTNVL